MADSAEMTQRAPYPHILADLVERLTYKQGWRFRLVDMDRGQGSVGLTLDILLTGPNSYKPEETIIVSHRMIVPPAAFDEGAWTRWLFEQCLLVEQHEAGEFFRVAGERPFGPHHQPGANPYTIHEVGTAEQTRLNSRGVVPDPG